MADAPVARGLVLGNGASAPLAAVPLLSFAEFGDALVAATESGVRVAALFGHAPGPTPSPPRVRLFAVLADAANGRLELLASDVEEAFPSLTPRCARTCRSASSRWPARSCTKSRWGRSTPA